MKKHQICIMLSDMQYKHFRSLLESEGCESVTEMFRKCVFGRWPIKKQPSATSSKAVPTVESTMSQHGHNHAVAMSEHGKEEKKEEREKSPHTPLKRKKQEKKNLSIRAHMRVTSVSPSLPSKRLPPTAVRATTASTPNRSGTSTNPRAGSSARPR